MRLGHAYWMERTPNVQTHMTNIQVNKYNVQTCKTNICVNKYHVRGISNKITCKMTAPDD